MKPQSIPWVIEKVRGMRIIVKNAGKTLFNFPEIYLRNAFKHRRADQHQDRRGCVAGTMPASGARNKHGRKQSAVKTDVKPGAPAAVYTGDAFDVSRA